MKKVTLSLFSLILFCGIMAAQPSGNQPTAEDLVIQVAPQTILLGRSAKVGNVWLTIHAEISYSQVLSVQLEGAGGDIIYPTYTKADNRGELVAKFDYDEVAEELGPG
ncbi:MAG: hypothetical protein KJN92_11355, partial [Gemmatimonadetes bacterium]|nr:hypothetical protein [Gemmatimonadota bacterium]